KLFSRRACDPVADGTLEEVREAFLSLRNGRAPGHNGLPKEFYTAFWHLLGPDLLEVYRALLEKGALSASMRKGVRTELGNWRPLTLLTTDCKVLAKVATARLQRVMGGLVSQDQTCGVPGRSCSWNLILLRDVLDWVELPFDANCLWPWSALTFDRAFDRVQHGFLFTVLGRMGFGPQFIGWVRTLARTAASG
ncbi:hypothetical protein AAFF_G00390690, partial [Aldrovandia affinis]